MPACRSEQPRSATVCASHVAFDHPAQTAEGPIERQWAPAAAAALVRLLEDDYLEAVPAKTLANVTTAVALTRWTQATVSTF